MWNRGNGICEITGVFEWQGRNLWNCAALVRVAFIVTPVYRGIEGGRASKKRGNLWNYAGLVRVTRIATNVYSGIEEVVWIEGRKVRE